MKVPNAKLIRECAISVMGWKCPRPHTGPTRVAPGFTMWADGRVYKHDHTGEWNPLKNDADCWQLYDGTDPQEVVDAMKPFDLYHLFSLRPDARRKFLVLNRLAMVRTKIERRSNTL